MVTVFDVARFIAEKTGSMSALKLQKLVHYSHAWHLVWDDEPLIDSHFEAWAHGPVVPVLYNRHRGEFKIDASMFKDGNVQNLSTEEKATIKKVLNFYGDKSAHWLSNLTHQERPWLEAWGNLPPGANSNAVISNAAIAEYYSSL